MLGVHKRLEPTAHSVRCAPAVGGGSPRAFGRKKSSDEDTVRFLHESYCSSHPQGRILTI
jgi:hypothetical protein